MILSLLTIALSTAFLFMMPAQKVTIDEFDEDAHLEWRIVNDGVMGGLSQSTMSITERGTAVFKGTVSLENNGGFASTRASVGKSPGAIDSVLFKVKGDGKRYSIRFRTNDRFDGPSYVASFETTDGEWTNHTIPLSKFKAQFRGYTLNDQPPLEGENIRQVAILIADKQKGPFTLELDFIYGLRSGD